jgi:hypothetical protein
LQKGFLKIILACPIESAVLKIKGAPLEVINVDTTPKYVIRDLKIKLSNHSHLLNLVALGS